MEFLEPPRRALGDPAAAPAGEPVAAGAPEAPRAASRAWPITFWLVAAACAVGAPFTRLYGVRTPGPDGYAQYVDGWGRLDVGIDAPATPGHDVAYGVAYVAAAALLVALAVLTLRRSSLRPSVAAALRPAAVAVAGLLAGLTAAVALAVEALMSRIQPASASAVSGVGEGGALQQPHVLVGPMVWLSLAAVVAAGLAALLQAVPVGGRRRGGGAVPSPATPAGLPAPGTATAGHPDELLP